MFPYYLSTIVLVLLAAVFQQFVPTFSGMHDARILLLPLVFMCCSVTISSAAMLLLAFVSGFLWDAQHVLLPQIGDPDVYKSPVESLPFGYSIVLYGIMGFLMQGVQPLFRRGKWQFSVVVMGIAVFIYLTSEYLLINFVRGDFTFTKPTLQKIVFTALITMIAAPFIYALLFKLANLCKYTIRYDGLRQKRRYQLD